MTSKLLMSVQPSGGGFAPTDIAGLVGWYDASDTATITDTGGAVTVWADKSASGYDLGSGDGVITTGSTTINSLNALNFTNGYIENTSVSVSAEAFTILVVCRENVSDPNGGIFTFGGGWNSTTGGSMHVDGSGLGIRARRNFQSATATSTAPVPLDVYTGRWDSDGSFHIWSGAGATDSYPPSATTWGTADLYRVGARRNISQKSKDLDVCELLIYDSSLSDANRGDAEDYLSTKWGTP